MSFHGLQDGETVLYVFKPHGLIKIVGLIKILVVCGVLGLLVHFASGTEAFEQYRSLGFFAVGVLLVILLWWNSYVNKRRAAFVTDRRFIRFDLRFPGFPSKRGLFWSEVAKAKAYAPNIAFRMMKVGNLEIQSTINALENIKVPYCYYYDDLSNYIEKVIFTYKRTPDKLVELKPFVTRPRGQRYEDGANAA